MTYDAIVIGGGQAGPFVAAHLAYQGEKIALVEGHKIGGTCVNYGCTPTKTMVASARVAHLARRAADFGVNTGPVTVDLAQVMARTDDRVNDAQSGMDGWMRGIDGLDVYDTYASFESSNNGTHRVRVDDEVIESVRVFLNTGTRPSAPPLPGLDQVHYLDNRSILSLKKLPEHLIVLGGGYVGLEFAQMFRRFGSEVTLIEMEDQLCVLEDADIAGAIKHILEDEGVCVMVNAQAKQCSFDPSAARVSEHDGHITVVVDHNGQDEDVTGTHLLVATGRTPNSDSLNLESVGIETDGGGFIVVDDHLRTNVPGVWALGDVNGRGRFTHTSYQDHEILLDNLNGGERSIANRNLAYAMFIDPALGRVGMTEKEARASGRNILMTVKPMNHIGHALERGETRGMIKLLADADTEQLVGAAILSIGGEEIVQVVSYYMATGTSYKVMQQALPVHPTIAEFFPTLIGELKPLE